MSGLVRPWELPGATQFVEAVDALSQHERDSAWRDAAPRAERIARIVESVSTVGTPQRRRAFAEQVLDDLRRSYETGKQAQDSFAIAERLCRELWVTMYALHILDTRLTIDRAAAKAVGLTPKLHELIDALGSAITEGIVAVQRLADKSEKPKRGRKKRLAVEICDTIARAYFRHFDRDPARSRRGSTGKPLPFQRACSVVQEILAEEGRPVSLGHMARLEGIKRNDIEEILAGLDRWHNAKMLGVRAGNGLAPPPPK